MELLGQDVDSLLSYHTKQQVQFRDRLLGITQYTIIAGIMAYIVGVVFIIDHGYLEFEASRGIVVTKVRGDVVASAQTGKAGDMSRLFDVQEITYPGLENGNVFIATKVTTEEQERGTCEDKALRCQSDSDCSKDVGAKCTPDRYCKEPSWCSKSKPAVYKLATDQMDIWVNSAINFQRLDNSKFYANNMEDPVLFPEPGFNTFKVRDILGLCDPPVRFEEVSELGASIEVQIVWNCQVDSMQGCKEEVRARRVDSMLDQEDIGFEFSHPEYDPSSPEEKRTKVTKAGIRFFFRTFGTGSKVSLVAIIFKLSTGMSLVGFAPIVADIIMLRCFKNSNKYFARKYCETEDLDDYFQKVYSKQERVAQANAELKILQENDDEEGYYDDEEKLWQRKMIDDVDL